MYLYWLNFKRKHYRLGIVAQVFNPKTWEIEAGVSLWVQGQSDLASKGKTKRKKKASLMVANLQIVEASKKLSPLSTMLPNVYISKYRVAKYDKS